MKFREIYVFSFLFSFGQLGYLQDVKSPRVFVSEKYEI